MLYDIGDLMHYIQIDVQGMYLVPRSDVINARFIYKLVITLKNTQMRF